jgi:hypothetical protein
VASTLSIDFGTPWPLVGDPNRITITAKDRFGNRATGYRGTVHFTIPDDGAASLPEDYTFTGGDLGSHTWLNGITLRTAGPQTITVADTVNPLFTASYLALAFPGEADYFLILDIPPVLTAGVSSDLTVVAIDGYGNTAKGYRGTVHVSSSDGSARLPADYSFWDYDGGFHTWYNGLTIFTAGQPTLTATDIVIASINQTFSLTVDPGAATALVVEAPAGVAAGAPFDVTVSARDPYGNLVTGYTGSVTLLSSDAAALLPPDYTFTPDDGGTHTFAGVTLFAAGDQGLTATDPDGGLAGSATVTVDPGPTAPGRLRPGSGRAGRPAGSSNLPTAPTGAVPKPWEVTAVDQVFATIGVDEGWCTEGVWPYLRSEPADRHPWA